MLIFVSVVLQCGISVQIIMTYRDKCFFCLHIKTDQKMDNKTLIKRRHSVIVIATIPLFKYVDLQHEAHLVHTNALAKQCILKVYSA